MRSRGQILQELRCVLPACSFVAVSLARQIGIPLLVRLASFSVARKKRKEHWSFVVTNSVGATVGSRQTPRPGSGFFGASDRASRTLQRAKQLLRQIGASFTSAERLSSRFVLVIAVLLGSYRRLVARERRRLRHGSDFHNNHPDHRRRSSNLRDHFYYSR